MIDPAQFSVRTFLLGYWLIMNLLGFLTMGLDKLKAVKRGFRIPEATLFLIAFIGGSIGSILGMIIFRHKIRKRRFTVGMPLILLLQAAVFLFLYLGPLNIRTI
ncbi:MAG: DUF1294 domain-containing protein [Lachnospiraceae bacterium]|nr:DUF1294 domain-containing protein [Lachnospiraceae bacterium]